jgi:hypothetical protein
VIKVKKKQRIRDYVTVAATTVRVTTTLAIVVVVLCSRKYSANS